MDTWTPEQLKRIEEGQQMIKAKMPKTYAKIREEAQYDKRVWGLVRRGLVGEANCFWAVEAGFTAGSPFIGVVGLGWAAEVMAQFGCAYVCTLAKLGAANGAH